MSAGGTWSRVVIAVACLAATFPLLAAIRIEVREGRPIVDGVYVNDRGPYRFVLDTGTNVNLMDASLAHATGMSVGFRMDLASAVGSTAATGSDDNTIALGPVRVGGQRFLFTDLREIRKLWPDVQGVLGQWFLAGFDYRLDLKGRQLEFGARNPDGKHTRFTLRNGRAVVSTSLGDLVLDSGADRLVLFGVHAGNDMGNSSYLTVAGSRLVGTIWRSLVIEGRNLWRGDAVAVPNQAEPGIAGLMPASLFKSVYVSNSEGFVVLE